MYKTSFNRAAWSTAAVPVQKAALKMQEEEAEERHSAGQRDLGGALCCRGVVGCGVRAGAGEQGGGKDGKSAIFHGI